MRRRTSHPRALGWGALAAGALAVLGGCAEFKPKPEITAHAVGPKRKRLPPDCPIREIEMEFGDASRLETYIGTVCVSTSTFQTTDPFSPKVQEAVRKEACKLGGDMVTDIGNCNEGRGTAFGVFSRK